MVFNPNIFLSVLPKKLTIFFLTKTTKHMAVDIAIDTDFMTNFEVTLTVFNNIIGWRVERFFFLHTNGTFKILF